MNKLFPEVDSVVYLKNPYILGQCIACIGFNSEAIK